MKPMEKKQITKIIFDKHSWLLSFILAIITMFLLLCSVGMGWNGKYLLLRGDGFEQYMCDIRMVTESILRHENPLYQFCLSMGFSAVLPIALEIINPFNLLYLIFHRADVNLITIIIMLLKAGLTGASFHLFAKKICKTNAFWATIISIFYTMNAFAVSYGSIYIFWLDVLYIIPLCAIAVHKTLFEKKTALLIIILSYSFITQFYMGYLTGIFSLLFYLLLLFTNYKRIEKKEVFRALLRFVISAVNAIMISAVVWIPVLLFLRKYNPSDRTMFSEQQIGFMEVFNNLFWGEAQSSSWAPYSYCGIPCLLLLLIFFLNKKIQIQEKIVYGILLLFYVLGCVVSPLYRLLHGFDAPDSYSFRFSFMLSFILCAIACKQIVFIRDIQRKYLLFWGIFLLAFFLLEGRFERFEIGDYTSNTGLNFFINMIFVLLWAGILLIYGNKTQKNIVLSLLVLSLTVIEVVSNGYASINAFDVLEFSGKTKKEYSEWKQEYESVLNDISGSNSFYRIAAFGDYLHNSDSYYGYNGLSDFCTGENEKMRHLMNNLGLYTSKAETNATGMMPTLEMLLSVKYELYLNFDAQDEEKNGKPQIKEMDYYLPAGYMVSRDSINDIPMGMNAFENHNTLIQTLSGVEGVYEPVPEEKIEYIEDGLVLSSDRKTLEKKADEGVFLAVVRNEDSPVFCQFEQEKREVDGILFMPFPNMACTSDSYVSFPITARLNEFDDSTKYVEIRSYESYQGDFSFEGINIYRLNEDKLRESHDILNQSVLNVVEWKNGYLKADIDIKDTDKILLTSVPKIDGWKVFINGEKAEQLDAINGTFIAVDFPGEGQYSIEFVYECPGLKVGALVSALGLLLLISVCGVKKIRVKGVKIGEEYWQN